MAWWNGVTTRARAGVDGVTTRVEAGVRGLREASDVAEAQRAGRTPVDGLDGGPSDDTDRELHLPVAEALLLVRYVGGRAALGRIEPFGVGKYALLAIAVAFLTLTDVPRWFAALWLVVFVASAILQWWLSRLITRFGLLDELSGIETAADQARTVWWPNLQAELARVGLSTRPFALLRLGSAHLARRTRPEQRAALAEVDWLNVLPHAQWREARALLAENARRSR